MDFDKILRKLIPFVFLTVLPILTVVFCILILFVFIFAPSVMPRVILFAVISLTFLISLPSFFLRNKILNISDSAYRSRVLASIRLPIRKTKFKYSELDLSDFEFKEIVEETKIQNDNIKPSESNEPLNITAARIRQGESVYIQQEPDTIYFLTSRERFNNSFFSSETENIDEI